jgi:uncharacterized protein (DUF58 family)
MSNRCQRAICREGVYYALMVAAVFAWALLFEANLLMLVGGLLCAPLLLNAWLCKRSLQGIDVRRRVVRSVTAGQALPVDIELANGRRRARWGLTVRDRLVPARPEHPSPPPLSPQFFVSLPSGQQRRQTYRVVLAQRGRYRFGPLQLSTKFPFGLLSAKRTVAGESDLIVYPRIGQLSPAWQRRYCPVPQGTLGSRRAGRAPGDFFAVREWRAGDSSRWVHWRRSARQGQLIVRQFEQPSDRRLVLLVDLWQPASPTAEDLERVELVVSFAATVVADLCRRPGFHLRLALTGDPPQWVSGSANASLMANALEQLAVAEASDRDGAAAVWETIREDLPEDVEILVVSPRAGTQQASDWRHAAPAGAAGRCQVVGPQEPRFWEYFKAV